MISQTSAQKIRESIPDIVQRGRMGEQNALAYLVEINKNRKSNPRASFAYECAKSYIKSNPTTGSGVVSINGEDDNVIDVSKLSPLACAIVIIPEIKDFDFSKISNMPLVLKYIISLISARNGDYQAFPLIEMES